MTAAESRPGAQTLALVGAAAVTNVASLSDEHIDDLLGAAASIRSELWAFEAELIVEIERRGRWASGVLAQTQGIGSRAAKRKVRITKRICGGRDGNDGLAQIAAAVGEHRIRPEQVALIAEQHRDYRTAIQEQQAVIIGQAEHRGYDDFVQWLARWRSDIDRQAGRSTADRQRKDRKASGGNRPEDGMYQFSATHEPLVGAAIAKQLAAVDNAMWRADAKLPKSQRRTPNERRADAHAWLVLRSVKSQSLSLPTAEDLEIRAALSRADVTIMVIATVEDLNAGRGELVNGTTVALDDVIKDAARLHLVPAVFDSNGVNLWQGRKHRIPTEPLRQAIIARDRHCTFEGCTVPSEWCQIHHIIWWSKGGTTDPPNLTLLCSEHHHFVHDAGWQVARQADGTLRWTAPAIAPEPVEATPHMTGPAPTLVAATTTLDYPPAASAGILHNLIRKEPAGDDADADAA